MFFLTVIKYLAVGLFVFYLFSTLAAWFYELRKNVLYLEMQKKLKLLEDMRLSAALEYAKAYKIKHDYHREIEPLERMQKFIMKLSRVK